MTSWKSFCHLFGQNSGLHLKGLGQVKMTKSKSHRLGSWAHVWANTEVKRPLMWSALWTVSSSTPTIHNLCVFKGQAFCDAALFLEPSVFSGGHDFPGVQKYAPCFSSVSFNLVFHQTTQRALVQCYDSYHCLHSLTVSRWMLVKDWGPVTSALRRDTQI